MDVNFNPKDIDVIGGVGTKSGYLYLRTTVLKSWKKRWVTFNGRKLRYYQDSPRILQGTIKLENILAVVPLPRQPTFKRNYFEVRTKDRPYTFGIESEHEMDSWLDVLNSAKKIRAAANAGGIEALVSTTPRLQHHSSPSKQPLQRLSSAEKELMRFKHENLNNPIEYGEKENIKRIEGIMGEKEKGNEIRGEKEIRQEEKGGEGGDAEAEIVQALFGRPVDLERPEIKPLPPPRRRKVRKRKVRKRVKKRIVVITEGEGEKKSEQEEGTNDTSSDGEEYDGSGSSRRRRRRRERKFSSKKGRSERRSRRRVNKNNNDDDDDGNERIEEDKEERKEKEKRKRDGVVSLNTSSEDLLGDIRALSTVEDFLIVFFEEVDSGYKTKSNKFPLKLVLINRGTDIDKDQTTEANILPSWVGASTLHWTKFYSYGNLRTALLLGDILLEWTEQGLVVPQNISPFASVFDINTVGSVEGASLELNRIAEVCIRYNVTNTYSEQTCNSQHFVCSILESILIDGEEQLGKDLWDYVNQCMHDTTLAHRWTQLPTTMLTTESSSMRETEDDMMKILEKEEEKEEDTIITSTTRFPTHSELDLFAENNKSILSPSHNVLLQTFDRAWWFSLAIKMQREREKMSITTPESRDNINESDDIEKKKQQQITVDRACKQCAFSCPSPSLFSYTKEERV